MYFFLCNKKRLKSDLLVFVEFLLRTIFRLFFSTQSRERINVCLWVCYTSSFLDGVTTHMKNRTGSTSLVLSRKLLL